jgi:hypothetical protein
VDLQERVANAFKVEGFEVLTTKIGAIGVTKN